MPGKTVRFQGLQGAAHLNGNIGELVRFDAAQQRWVVRYATDSDGTEFSMVKAKAENLVVVNFTDLLNSDIWDDFLAASGNCEGADMIGGPRGMAQLAANVFGHAQGNSRDKKKKTGNGVDGGAGGGNGDVGFEEFVKNKMINLACKEIEDGFPKAIACILADIKDHFRKMARDGVAIQDRVVGLGVAIRKEKNDHSNLEEVIHGLLSKRVRGVGGMKVANQDDVLNLCPCDVAILVRDENVNDAIICRIKQSLLPNGVLWMIVRCGTDQWIQDAIKEFPDSIWHQSMYVYQPKTFSRIFRVVKVPKRPCVVNEWSCPWMNKDQEPSRQLTNIYNKTEKFFPHCGEESFLQYERALMFAVTIVPSVAERTTPTESENSPFATILSEESIRQAYGTLEKHGMVIIKGLLSPSQTVPWGVAALNDLNSAVERLKCHPTRPIDLLNNCSRDTGKSGETTEESVESVDYKEMTMTGDLRVDVRSGPEMEKLRMSENNIAMRTMTMKKPSVDEESIQAALESLPISERREIVFNKTPSVQDLGLHDGPTTIPPDVVKGSVNSWRFHPSILAIIRRTFNPLDPNDPYRFKGNFATRSQYGPGVMHQPYRLGQVSSTISCPGSVDEAIHADTPHLYEHADYLPCHYLNVITPGYHVVEGPASPTGKKKSFENEFIDGMWTGNSTMGWNAFVYGSHDLGVSTELLAEDDEGDDKKEKGAKSRNKRGDVNQHGAAIREKMLWLRTLRPSLEAGDVLIFDGRMIHFGLANTSGGDPSGNDVNAGRMPMLHFNAMQSWFRDPTNDGDAREKIFD